MAEICFRSKPAPPQATSCSRQPSFSLLPYFNSISVDVAMAEARRLTFPWALAKGCALFRSPEPKLRVRDTSCRTYVFFHNISQFLVHGYTKTIDNVSGAWNYGYRILELGFHTRVRCYAMFNPLNKSFCITGPLPLISGVL